MVASSANETISNARRYKTNQSGMCLMYSRTWLEIGSSAHDAYDAWVSADHKHPGDMTPPRGAPVFWRGGSRGYGHIGVSTSSGNFRGTDMPSSNQVSERPISWVNQNWGQIYLGWTEDLNGVDVPYLNKAPRPPSKFASGSVYVTKLEYKQHDSDSVGRLCYRLRHHAKIPGTHKPPHQSDRYGKELLEAVRYWQRNVHPNVHGPNDGLEMSNPQANVLFGKNYQVYEEQ